MIFVSPSGGGTLSIVETTEIIYGWTSEAEVDNIVWESGDWRWRGMNKKDKQ